MTETYNEHKPAFDDLAAAWQRECERLDRIAGKYPVGPSLIDACTKRQPLSRTLMRTALLRTLVCLAALAWLAGLYRRYVVDVWDLVPHLFIGGLLLYNIVYGLLVVVLLKRHGMAVPTPLLQHDFGDGRQPRRSAGRHGWRIPHVGLQRVRATALAAVAAVGFITYTPSYDGRTASMPDADMRGTVISNVNQILVNTANTAAA